MEVPQEDCSPQEISQKPTPTMDNSAVVQDPFDTQMEVPFSEDIWLILRYPLCWKKWFLMER